MLDETVSDRWTVRAHPEAAPEAVIERFGGGYRLSRWSPTDDEPVRLGVFTSPELAETAWWRSVDRERNQGRRTMSARRTGLEDA
ncbi:hypothetical protein [Frigoribacterium sp. VKM Ac-2836]|uniref:hypothetical protein n=1 Tax=Frigoribacterium sp. VKM Ac-2836 TaxID=2739014 RepID=UPI00156444DD|nr:hypothetical protein [Frigoribacterium sp. VKM Ac-2836]NRD26052.1 hypothetical protein [Frigoribacterium sp. VKM Ac-2836]